MRTKTSALFIKKRLKSFYFFDKIRTMGYNRPKEQEKTTLKSKMIKIVLKFNFYLFEITEKIRQHFKLVDNNLIINRVLIIIQIGY